MSGSCYREGTFAVGCVISGLDVGWRWHLFPMDIVLPLVWVETMFLLFASFELALVFVSFGAVGGLPWLKTSRGIGFMLSRSKYCGDVFGTLLPLCSLRLVPIQHAQCLPVLPAPSALSVKLPLNHQATHRMTPSSVFLHASKKATPPLAIGTCCITYYVMKGNPCPHAT